MTNQLRHGALALCIGWTILSRSLLLKLGMSNSPGSTFLPPEIVECFQSFSIGAKEMDGVTAEHDKPHTNFALLSHWKQISATLIHATYIKDAFSHFDSRTVNIERALNDLDVLLRCYAVSDEAARNYARLTDLREVLRRGARFAFTLFGQPSFWKFDWTVGPLTPGNPASDGSHESEQRGGVSLLGEGTGQSLALDMAVWPSLVRVMDGEGRKVEGDVLGRKR
ncbi:hypothetical protein BDV96DRAFT_141325 [Lophiotrema nucula]|uniref:Uncharacterized protein n=1 Tax=Lophiotrema nucula TaxID=690887 RepID=A0A6A5ZTG1_9PLEO|nr:hypothetical protein BDV96DRAFT_141325 [Lophiotrema nucula]